MMMVDDGDEVTLGRLHAVVDAASDLADKTKYVYKQRLRLMVEDWCSGDVRRALHDPQWALSRAGADPETRKSHINPVLSCFKRDPAMRATPSLRAARSAWYDQLASAKEACNARYDSQQPSPAQKAAAISWDDLVRARDAQAPGTIEHIVLGLYCEAVMRNDLSHVYVYRGSRYPVVDVRKTPNYIVMTDVGEGSDRATLHLNEFKTAKDSPGAAGAGKRSRGKRGGRPAPLLDLSGASAQGASKFSVQLSAMLTDSIRASLDRDPREYLFVRTDNGSPYSNEVGWHSRVTKILRSTLGNPKATINSIRHAFASRVQRDARLSDKEKDSMASMAMHSAKTNRMYSWVAES